MRPLLGLLALFAATPAFAHAMLESANPAAGATLPKTPKEIVLSFSEALEPSFSNGTVRSADGHVVSTAAQTKDHVIRIPLKPLAAGTYRVKWRAVSIDTHATQGSFSFTVKP